MTIGSERMISELSCLAASLTQDDRGPGYDAGRSDDEMPATT